MISILPILLIPLAYRYAQRWITPQNAPSLGTVTTCALLGALANLWLCTSVLAKHHVTRAPLDDDFVEYCSTVAVLGGWLPAGIEPFALRPPFPLLPTALLSQFEPLISASFHASQFAFIGLAVLCFAWATLLGGVTAGVVALATFGAFAPLATASLQVTTYPEMALATGLACFGGCLVVLRRDVIAFATAGTGIGCALLSDQLGLIWALPVFAVAAAVVCITPNRSKTAAALLIPIALSYGVGRALPVEVEFFPGDHTPALQTLENRLAEHEDVLVSRGSTSPSDSSAPGAARTEDAPIDHGNALAQIGETHLQPGYYWGRAGPSDLLGALVTLTTARGEKTSQIEEEKPIQRVALKQISTALGISLLGLTVVGWRFRREPAVALGLVLCLAPCVAWIAISPKLGAQLSPVGDGTTYIYWTKLKLLLPGFTAAPVLLGLIWSMLSGDAPSLAEHPKAPQAPEPARWLRPLLLGGLALLLTLGWLPSRLSPTASWRTQVDGSTDNAKRELSEIRALGPRRRYLSKPAPHSPCRARLYEDLFGSEATRESPP